jgi:hypothetical protein
MTKTAPIFLLRSQSFGYYSSFSTFQVAGTAQLTAMQRLTVEATRRQYVIFEVSMAVTMKNGVFWDVTPCGCCKNRRFGGT